jgi:hypothetical protein
MALEGTMAAMGAMFGAIYFRRACQSNDVLSQGMNARYNPVQGSVLLIVDQDGVPILESKDSASLIAVEACLDVPPPFPFSRAAVAA